jgi:single-stranded-DNA-specific exonuclease
VGVQALKATARLSGPRVTSTDVAFSIAPRINALGRMGNARDALSLLLTDDPVEAYRIADRMERLNRERRTADEAVLQDALEQLRLRGDLPPVVVLWSDTWPVGVVGIAANRILDRFHRPALLIALEGDRGRGSGRAPDGFALPEALQACTDLLDAHGGHARAAGFTIPCANLEAFRERMETLAAGADLSPAATPWELDATVSVDELDPACVSWLERLEPFGQGNPEPLFGSRRVRLEETPTVVGGRHLRLGFHTSRGPMKGIGFSLGSRVKEFERGQEVDVVFHASFDLFRGGRTVQLVVRDIR